MRREEGIGSPRIPVGPFRRGAGAPAIGLPPTIGLAHVVMLANVVGLLAGCGVPDLAMGGPLPDPEQEAWALAGRVALPSSARVMAERNPAGLPLADTQRSALRPYFDDLVDRVRVVWDAKLLDQWAVGRYALRPSNWGGQSYGDRIYLNQPMRPGDAGQLQLLAHELVHSRQTERFGGLEGFGYEYFKGYYLAGLSYEGNGLEREAIEFQAEFAARQPGTAP